MRKLLVTGAGGFIGSYLTRHMSEAGYQVTAVLHRQGHCQKIHNVHYVTLDMAQPIELSGTFDAVIHAAGVSPGQENSFADFKHGNIDSMENLLAWMQQGHATRVINLSAVSVYGEAMSECLDEDTPVISPSDYGLSKYVAERMLIAAPGIKGLSLRMPGVFGRHATRGWLAKVVGKLIKNEDVTIYAPDFINNNYLYVADLATFIETLLDKEWTQETMVLGMTQGLAIREAVELARERLESSSRISVVDSLNKPFALGISRAQESGFQSHSFGSMINECLSRGGWTGK